MNRTKLSLTYAATCQQIIDECGDDYKKGSELIYDTSVPHNLHPMLRRVIELAEYIIDDFRGEKSERHDWQLIKTTVARFLAGEWEPTAWLATAMYGFEEDGIARYSYSISIQRHGSTTTYESGNEQLVDTVKKLADEVSPNQTDEWFMYALLQKLPEKIGELRLQSNEIVEVTT